jgi:hypothetical protein
MVKLGTVPSDSDTVFSVKKSKEQQCRRGDRGRIVSGRFLWTCFARFRGCKPERDANYD